MRVRRDKEYDLRPLIEELDIIPDPASLRAERSVSEVEAGRGEIIFMRLAAREGATGRPEEVLDVLGIAFDETRIERTRLIFKENVPQDSL